MTTMRGLAVLIIAILTAVSLSSCSVVSGGPTAGEIDVRTLNIGKYPVKPLDINNDAEPGMLSWSQVGSLRLGEDVATPDQVSPGLVSNGDYHPRTFSAQSPAKDLGDSSDMQSVAQRHRLMFGFESEGYDTDTIFARYDWPYMAQNGTGLSIMVMQFGSPAEASAAATEFYEADFGRYQDQNQPAPIAKYPDTHAHWRPGTPTLRSFLAHGPYVTALLVATPTADLTALTMLAQQAYDVQLPKLDARNLITDEDAVHLPLDPDHILSRTLNPYAFEMPLGSSNDQNTVVGPHTLLNYEPNFVRAKQTLDALGVTSAAFTDSALVLRTADPNHARKAVTDHLTMAVDGSVVDVPPGVPDATCLQYTGWAGIGSDDGFKFLCIVAYRQYVGYVASLQLTDAQQKAAAQYALFANSQWE
ncbi:DUF7373 family lipoprotein [Nocardia stercoris]|uniref:Uncharacterized protein n=1 Tax=Nocardia stercoris TaxID=2483361 RepID=A0A3M2L280_9NOCA|nr:hypothetical protein [Nocardia stercoris]RMI31829.1 hypothetical protein EBN03_16775 [Nocardia stercoris]